MSGRRQQTLPVRPRSPWGRLAIGLLKPLGVLGLALVLAMAATLVTIEWGCAADPASVDAAGVRPPASGVPADLPGYRRPEAVSYLTYPEWSIVHAYEDLAAVMARADESAFGYAASIAGFWRGHCRLNRLVGAQDPAALGDTRLMLYTIGFSFTAELAAKGLYENTLGRLAEAVRGERKNAVDRHLAEVAARYAEFLQQTPWYQFPFAPAVGALWAVPREAGDSWLRHWERRLAMTVEFGAKAGYARLIAWAAGSLGPVDRTTQALMAARTAADLDRWLASESDVTVVARYDATTALVRGPRYRAFTRLLERAAAQHVWPVEIAGNRRGLVTVFAPVGMAPPPTLASTLFGVPLSAQPGRQRLAVDLPVLAWPDLLAWIEATPGAALEHFYDY